MFGNRGPDSELKTLYQPVHGGAVEAGPGEIALEFVGRDQAEDRQATMLYENISPPNPLHHVLVLPAPAAQRKRSLAGIFGPFQARKPARSFVQRQKQPGGVLLHRDMQLLVTGVVDNEALFDGRPAELLRARRPGLALGDGVLVLFRPHLFVALERRVFDKPLGVLEHCLRLLGSLGRGRFAHDSIPVPRVGS